MTCPSWEVYNVPGSNPFLIEYGIRNYNVNGEDCFMPYLTVEEMARVMKGKIVLGSRTAGIALRVASIGGNRAGTVTFLTRPISDEDRILAWLHKHGATCVIVTSSRRLTLQKWRKAHLSVIQVANLYRAHQALARAYRRQLNIPFIQVIGSAGKTTTKEMIGAVLQESLNPLVGLQNDNLPNGVARNILRVRDNHRAAVLEAGTLGPGIMRTSTRMIKPDIAVVTSIQRAHVMRMGSMQKIINAKGEIFEYLAENGTLILNGEDANIDKLPLNQFQGSILSYGFSSKHDIWASDITREGFKTYFTANTEDFQISCMINIIGQYNVGNALAAILVALQLGLTPDQISRGLAGFRPVENRLKIHSGKNGIIFIDDNFNANPDSTGLLIEEVGSLCESYPLVLVLGDMERPSESVRKYARQVHFAVGQQLAGKNIKHVLAIGKWAREYLRGAAAAGFPPDRIEHYPTVAAARKRFRKLLAPGTVVVLKASVYTPVRRLMQS